MAAPAARGLFSKAIAESAYMISMPELKQRKFGIPSAEESGTKLAPRFTRRTSRLCGRWMRGTLTEAAPAAGYRCHWRTIDGHVLCRAAGRCFRSGRTGAGAAAGRFQQRRDPLADESWPRLLPRLRPNTKPNIRERYLDLADEFLRLYPSTNLQESIWATTRDALYGWTAVRLVRKQTALGQSAFLYLFDHGYPAEDAAGLHAFHASELPYVFGTLDSTPPLWPKIPATPEETKLSDAMIGYWSSFARTGRPRAANEPDWPAFDSTGDYMAFTDAPHPSKHLMPGMYELNEEVVCRRRASGDIPWGWNVGIISPKMPRPTEQCKH